MEIRVKIITKSKKESVEILPDLRYLVSVKADRKDGAANKRMCELLSMHFGIEEKDVSLVSGHTSQTKTVRIRVRPL